MRKIYSLFAAVVLAATVNAQTTTVTFDFTAQGYANETAITGGVIDSNLSFTTDKGESNQSPTYYTANPASARIYSVRGTGNGNSFTITPATGYVITGLTFTATAAAYTPVVKYSVDGGTAQTASLSGTVYTIEGIEAESSLTFVNAHYTGGTSGSNTQLRIPSFTVTYKATTATPVLNADVASLDFSQVEISSTSDKTVEVTGENLAEAPTYAISGADADQFSAAGTLTTAGGTITVTFAPTSTGVKNAVLTITSGTLTKTVDLTGEGMPTLSVVDVNTKVSLVKNTSVENEIIFAQDAKVSLVNMNGQVVKTAQVSANSALNVAGLPKGMYVVTAVVNGKAVSQKIIKK